MPNAEDIRLQCDGPLCDERHPLVHEGLGDISFGVGRWLGWLYLDLNRPDIFPRELRFCGRFCLGRWLDRETVTGSKHKLTALDRALRAPYDEVARRKMLAELTRSQHVRDNSLVHAINGLNGEHIPHD